MSIPLLLLLLLVLSLTPLLSATSLPGTLPTRPPTRCATPPTPGAPPSDAFCVNPPTEDLDLSGYKGTWFQIYGSGSALRFSGPACTTANYRLNRNGTVAVLNCSARRPGTVPQCVRARASPRTDTSDSGKLQVFFPNSPPSPFNPGRYSVAALVGTRSFYLAAAVYSCSQIPGRPNEGGFFVLSRTTLFPQAVLYLVKLRLKCKGYDTSQMFKEVEQGGCKYFFNESGFTADG